MATKAQPSCRKQVNSQQTAPLPFLLLGANFKPRRSTRRSSEQKVDHQNSESSDSQEGGNRAEEKIDRSWCWAWEGAAAVSPAAKPAAEGGGHPEAKKQQQRVVEVEKMKKGGEPGEVTAAGKERQKDRQKDPPIVMVHQFPFHSRPGLL
ncbi:hypothetical protein C2845_PM17G07250 [Panicum miliaceum]|uniref:Uncharacterized protein n=1 Tax=Panicum miliaceum TaxID=4540 RepID=A0A3L6Q2C3_PANMI|nr:hypothetical protein C2845_PM17G07250 [Panicum miliaceum]